MGRKSFRPGNAAAMLMLNATNPQTIKLARTAMVGVGMKAQRVANDLLKVVANPIAIKAALNLLGHDAGTHRLPLVPPSDDEISAVRACLERLGLLVTH